MAGEEVRRAQARARRASQAWQGFWLLLWVQRELDKGTRAKEGQDLIVPRQYLPDYWLENKLFAGQRWMQGDREEVRALIRR